MRFEKKNIFERQKRVSIFNQMSLAKEKKRMTKRAFNPLTIFFGKHPNKKKY